MKKRRAEQKPRPAGQPDEKFRREASQDDPDYEREHDFSTESERWGEPGSSRDERGYPAEGERGVPRGGG